MDSENTFGVISCSVMLLALLIFVFVGVGQTFGNYTTFVATVHDTFIDDGNTFFVLELEDGTLASYCNEDNIFYGKMNSNDYLMLLEVGKNYEFESVGKRIPAFSAFPNIVGYKEVSEN